MRPRLIPLSFIISFVVLAACSPQRIQPTSAVTVGLTPFSTSTHGPSLTPEGLVAAGTPLPSPTPFTYAAQRGDTISSIALKFGVSIEDLQSANPGISPNAMSVGQVLMIPSNPGNPSGEATQTPVPFTLRQIRCYGTADRGMWCFLLAHNDTSDFMENVSAQVTLVDANDTLLASQTAFLPLNILPPNSSLPLTVFFAPEVPFEAKPRVQVLTAIRLLPHDQRYLPATIGNTLVQIDAEGRTAHVTGQVFLQGPSGTASQVWVAATAFDEGGGAVGVRRWESDATVAPGGMLPFEFMVSSIGDRIARVEFAVEARP